jgi:two-component system, OmpR family, sensor kinase
MIDSVRTRLTLWHAGVLALVLLVFSGGIYALLARNLQRRTDAVVGAALVAMKHLLAYERAEGDTELEAARNTVAELRYPQTSLAVYAADGQLLAETQVGVTQATLPIPPTAISESAQYFTLPAGHNTATDGARVAVLRVIPAANAAPNLVVAAHSLEQVNAEMEALRQVFLLAVPLAVVLVSLSGWFLARKSLAPVVDIAERAEQIGAANLSERLPVINPRDELGRMALTFNKLLARLELAFAQQRQFMADASHELRTPLHVIRTAAEVTLEESREAEDAMRERGECHEALAMVNEQARRLTRIVEDMFTLARADAGQRVLEFSDFYFDELLLTTVRAAAILADRKGVIIETTPTHEAPFRGDEGLLRQMLLNLLDNAVKHTPIGGSVRVHMAQRNSACEITVADTGAGIPPEAQPHIFERFYRADKARARSETANGAGAGLGLAIARWVAEAHAGTLTLRRSDASGSVFVISLPTLVIHEKG